MGLRPDQLERDTIAERHLAIADQMEARLYRPEAATEFIERGNRRIRCGLDGRRRLGLCGAANVVGFRQRPRPRLVARVDETRHVCQTGLGGGRQPPVPANELEPCSARSHEERLHDAKSSDRRDERIEPAQWRRRRNGIDVADRNRPQLRERRACGQLLDVVLIGAHPVPGGSPSRCGGRGSTLAGSCGSVTSSLPERAEGIKEGNDERRDSNSATGVPRRPIAPCAKSSCTVFLYL